MVLLQQPQQPQPRRTLSRSSSGSGSLPQAPKRQGPLGRLARPTSPAQVLSPAAVERLGSPLARAPPSPAFRTSKSAPQIGQASGVLPQLGKALIPGASDAQAQAQDMKWLGRVRKNFDRRLVAQFDEVDQQRTVPLEASSSSKRAGSPERQDIGLSVSSRRENYKKEQYGAHIERAGAAGGSPGGTLRESDLQVTTMTAEDLGLMAPELFEKDINAVQKQFGDLEKSIRLEHMTEGGQAERLKAEREAERRRREEAMRRARKKEQQARDPKKKVALRLENKREFEKDKAENDVRLPITNVDFGGGYKGHEEVPLVDVLKLRQKCTFMEEGVKVRNMVETMARRDRQEKSARASVSLHSASGPSLFSSLSATHSKDELWEIKRQHFKDQGDSRHVDNLLRRISTMRNTLSYQLPYKFEVAESPLMQLGPVSQRRQSALRIAKSSGVANAAATKRMDRQVAMALAAHLEDGSESPSEPSTPTASPAGKRLTYARGTLKLQAMMAEIGAPGADALVQTLTTSVKKEKKPKKEKTEQPDPAAEESKKRAQKRWMMARALVQWVIIYRVTLRRNRAAEVVHAMVTQLGEWARMRKAITHYMHSVKVMQRTCKVFLKIKRQRCTQIEKEWQRVEDHHLQAYFSVSGLYAPQKGAHGSADKHGANPSTAKVKQHKAKMKANSAEAKQQQELIKLMEAGVESGEFSFDWRSYRIPIVERKRAVSRFYMSQLRKHVRTQSNFLETVRTAVNAEHELASFLQAFDPDGTISRDLPDKTMGVHEPVEQSVFWQANEDTLLQLIAIAAQSLVPSIDLFKHHPANLDLPEGAGASKARSRIAQARGEAQPVALGRLCRKPKDQMRSKLGMAADGSGEANSRTQSRGEDPKSSQSGKVDVEQVFDRFTPRLREITEEQTAGFRNQGAGGETEVLVLGLANSTQLPSSGGG